MSQYFRGSANTAMVITLLYKNSRDLNYSPSNGRPEGDAESSMIIQGVIACSIRPAVAAALILQAVNPTALNKRCGHARLHDHGL